MTAPDFELARLRNDGAWLRRFVRTLVPAQEVDDLVQTTWLAALQRRFAVHNPQQWLCGVAANLGRMLHRQRRREGHALQHARSAEAEVPTVDLVAGLEVQRAVSEALLELPEPTRTILVLRYQEGVEPAAIARRLGLQAPAVRQRLHRGRELVRAKLQQRFGPDWRSCAGVLVFAGSPEQCLATVSAPSSVAVAATAVLILGGLAAAGWVATVLGEIEPPQPTNEVVAEGAAAPDRPMARAADAATRTLVVANEQDPAKPVAANPIEVRGRMVAAEDGSPLAGVKVDPTLRWHRNVAKADRAAPQTVVTGADGRFVVPCPAAAVSISLWITAEGRCTRWYDASPPRTIDLGDAPMTRGYAVRGRLVDEKEQPMEGIGIATKIDGDLCGGGTLSHPTKTAADGSFACDTLVPAGPFEFRSGTPGVELIDATIEIVAKAEPNHVVLHGRRLPAIRGTVFGPDGAPCAGVELAALDLTEQEPFNDCGSGRSAADGSFEVFLTRGEAAIVRVTTAKTAHHEVIAELAPCAWGTSGLRLDVRQLIPVRLRIVEAGTKVPVERFVAFAVRQIGRAQITHSGENMGSHEGGLRSFAGLTAATRIVVLPEDPLLPPVVTLVDEAMRTVTTVEVEIARLQPFALTLVDARDRAVAIDFHVIDRLGATAPEPWNDPRTGHTCSTSTCMRLSSATSDGRGTATLMAPIDRRQLVVAVRRGDRDVWLPLVLPAAGKPIRLVLPD